LLADLSAGVSLARPVQFDGGTPLHCFGAAPASSVPLVHDSSSVRVAHGAGCNCSVTTLTAHANGTHTECASHLTLESLDAYRVIPQRLLVAVLLSVQPEQAGASAEGTQPEPQPDDRLITRAALEHAWPAALAERLTARAAVIRTRPNAPDKFTGAGWASAPFLSLPAASALVERGIAHLVLDVPSADRAEDGGLLSAHRVFFGLPPGSTHLAEAERRDSTLTELAYIEDAISDGWYLLSLQSSAIAGDAVPSRPLLYPLRLA
jgi:kynurenine formamidase